MIEAIFGIILAVLIIAGVIIYNVFSWGTVVFYFWQWFLLPIFPSAPAITFIQAIGLYFLISLTHQQESQSVKKEYRDDWQPAVGAILAPWITLFIGWIAQRWMY